MLAVVPVPHDGQRMVSEGADEVSAWAARVKMAVINVQPG
jgi:hypothetical protein